MERVFEVGTLALEKLPLLWANLAVFAGSLPVYRLFIFMDNTDYLYFQFNMCTFNILCYYIIGILFLYSKMLPFGLQLEELSVSVVH